MGRSTSCAAQSPEVGDLGQQFGGAMRFRTGLPRDVSEVIIIMTGRFWMAQYEWNSHKNAALQNGVTPARSSTLVATGRRHWTAMRLDGCGKHNLDLIELLTNDSDQVT